MSKSFSLALEGFADLVEAKYDRAVRKATLASISFLVLESPVLTGRFRANWRYGIDAVDRTVTEAVDKPGSSTVAAMSAEVRPGVSQHTAFISNSLPYAVKLEYGHSKKKGHMVHRLTMAWPNIVAQAVASEKS